MHWSNYFICLQFLFYNNFYLQHSQCLLYFRCLLMHKITQEQKKPKNCNNLCNFLVPDSTRDLACLDSGRREEKVITNCTKCLIVVTAAAAATPVPLPAPNCHTYSPSLPSSFFQFAMYLSVRHVCVNCAEVRALSGNWVFSVLCAVCTVHPVKYVLRE